MRLIDADALYDKVDESRYNNGHKDGKIHTNHYAEHNHFLLMISDAPTIEAEPIRHGKWLLECEPDGTPYCFHCSVCDDDFSYIDVMSGYERCPHCGAKMDE